MYLLSRTADKDVLFGDALLYVGEDVQSGAVALPCDEGLLAEFCHEGLDGFHVGLAPLDAIGKALQQHFTLVRLDGCFLTLL